MKALIIDDEPMPAKHLREMIKQYCFEIEEVNIMHYPKQAIQHLKENEYDLLFLDVEMPEMSGIEFLKTVELPTKTAVIFTTAYSEYAVDAFKANATHYIMKPVEEGELIKAVRKALLKKQGESSQVSSEGTITVYDGEDYLVVKEKDVIHLEADGSYTKFILKNRAILASKRMGYYQEKIKGNNFLRCHNSHIVNVQEINRISKGKGGYLIMSNGDTVPISASKKEHVEKILGLS